MNGGQAVPAANGPITQKRPVTLMQVSLYLIVLVMLIVYIYIIILIFIF